MFIRFILFSMCIMVLVFTILIKKNAYWLIMFGMSIMFTMFIMFLIFVVFDMFVMLFLYHLISISTSLDTFTIMQIMQVHVND